VKQDSDWWICSCGKRLPVTKDQVLLAPLLCPDCGKSISPSDTEDAYLAASETQTINIEEMARMAQDGVDIGVSGEWDTAFGPDPGSDKKD